MPHEFTGCPAEPEPQPAGSGRKPPGTGTAVLDFVPPEPHSGPPRYSEVSVPMWVAILMLLIAIGAAILINYVP